MINKTKILISFFSVILLYYFFTLSENVDTVFFSMTIGLFFYVFLMLSIDKEIVNPLSLMFPFILGVYYYQYMLSSKQETLSLDTISAIIFFIFFYVLGVLLTLLNKKSILKKKIINHKIHSVLVVDLFLIFGLVIFLIECALTGGFPFFIALIHKINVYEDMYYVPILHYFVMLIAIFPSVYYYFYKNNKVGRFKFFVVLFVSIFVLLNIMSRQIFIFSIVFMFFTYAKVNKINTNKYILKAVIFTSVMFLVLGFVRIQSINNSISQLEYLKAYAGVPKERNVNTFDVTFNLYTSQNLVTLNDMITKVDSQEFGYGKYSLQSFIKVLKYDQAYNIEYAVQLDSFARLGTIIADPYLDFGLVGVTLLAILYGIINTVFFLKAKHSDSIRYTFFWAVLCFIMIMSVFTNFYNVLFSWLIFLFIYFITLKAKTNK